MISGETKKLWVLGGGGGGVFELCEEAEEVGQALVWLICTCVGKLRNAIFFSKVKQGQGEQLQAATSGLCEGQRSVLSSSVDRAELAISCQLFRFTSIWSVRIAANTETLIPLQRSAS